MPAISKVARENGLDPSKFCKIRNTCFAESSLSTEPAGMKTLASQSGGASSVTTAVKAPAALREGGGGGWRSAATNRVMWLPQKLIQLTTFMNQEWQDWFEDPIETSDWLIRQQERVVLADPGGGSTGSSNAGGEEGAIAAPTSSPPLVDYLANGPRGAFNP